MRTQEKHEITKICCRASPEKGKKGEFEREYILLLLRIGVETRESDRGDQEASFYGPLRGRLKTKSAIILDFLIKRWFQSYQYVYLAL